MKRRTRAKSRARPHVLFRDVAFVAVHKPAGFTVYPESGDSPEENCQHFVEKTLKCKAIPVHRLDRDTCGVVLYALSHQAGNVLRRSFERRLIHKTYLAIVLGLPEKSGIIKSALKRRDGGVEQAATSFQTLGSFELGAGLVAALLKVEPRTGRFHQIRRHLKSLGHPIIGDAQYGLKRANEYAAKSYAIHRTMLSAVEVRLRHPRSGQEITVSTSPDSDFERLARRCV